MYKNILLASDGTLESLVALREGALIARALGSRAHLLIIDRDDVGRAVAQSVHPMPESDEPRRLLNLGLNRLASLGVKSTGEVVRGEPSQLIAQAVRKISADLVVVGHRRQTFLERWWSGSSGAYIVDSVSCSILVGRNIISDQELAAYVQDGEQH